MNIVLHQNRSEEPKTDYRGFILQPGFWFGKDKDTDQPVATSGWQVGDSVALYFKDPTTKIWEMTWINPEEHNIEAHDFDVPDFGKKKSFKKWLEEDYGIVWNDYDENYCGSFADEVESNYQDYLYDGLPLFARSDANIAMAQKEAEQRNADDKVNGVNIAANTYRDGFKMSIKPYIDSISEGSAQAAKAAFFAMSDDYKQVKRDIENRSDDEMERLLKNARQVHKSCYQLLRSANVSKSDAETLLHWFKFEASEFGKDVAAFYGADFGHEEAEQQMYEGKNTDFSDFLQKYGIQETETLKALAGILTRKLVEEYSVAKSKITTAATLEQDTCSVALEQNIQIVYNLGRENGLSAQQLSDMVKERADHDISDFTADLEVGYLTERNVQYNRELEELIKDCRERGIEPESLDFELRKQTLDEKYPELFDAETNHSEREDAEPHLSEEIREAR